MPSTSPPQPAHGRAPHLADFQVDRRLIAITLAAIPIGAAGAVLAYALLRLIGLVTNLVFFQRLSTSMVAPAAAPHRPLLILLAPVAGGLVVGLIARYGSEKVRGHGIPEAIDAILAGGSRVQARVAILKPLSAAIAIGTGGPFGAEGPIIMTGGAAGSLIAQHMRLSADERKALMAAGAVAGMAAVFNAPLASVLFAVELLLFEWRPRSFVPVAAAVATSTLLRGPLLGTAELFPLSVGHVHANLAAALLCVPVGLSAGLLAVIANLLVYGSEELFERLPIHWMWWPAIGGLVIGIGGLIEPQALGVGYNVIGRLLSGHAALTLIVGILVVKTLIWGISLGSGTSGGVLAPVFMIGAALGALEGHVLPGVTPGFWALIGLCGVLGGVMRCPLTGIVFPLELTGAWPLLLPLVIASTSAYALSTLFLRRSLLTEKLARRGMHLIREYTVDPLETVLVHEVMRPLAQDLISTAPAPELSPIHPDHTLRHVATLFAIAGHDSAHVVARDDGATPVGIVTLRDLLEARVRDHRDEHHRERLLPARQSRHVREL
jgi:chloride channel protein, CIC family